MLGLVNIPFVLLELVHLNIIPRALIIFFAENRIVNYEVELNVDRDHTGQ